MNGQSKIEVDISSWDEIQPHWPHSWWIDTEMIEPVATVTWFTAVTEIPTGQCTVACWEYILSTDYFDT